MTPTLSVLAVQVRFTLIGRYRTRDQIRWCGWCSDIRSLSMTKGTPRIRERLACFRHELPIKTSGVECQLENSKGINVSDLTIPDNCCQRRMIGSPTTHNELTDAADRVQRSTRCLGGEPLIDMVMPSQDQIRVVVV